MEDRERYWYLLGLKSPWTVGGVSLGIKRRRVDVWAEHPEGQLWPCPLIDLIKHYAPEHHDSGGVSQCRLTTKFSRRFVVAKRRQNGRLKRFVGHPNYVKKASLTRLLKRPGNY